MQRTAPPGRAVFGAQGSGPASEEVKARAQAAVQQLGGTGNVGARLMAQMGYGTAGAGLGRAGQVRGRGQYAAGPGLGSPWGGNKLMSRFPADTLSGRAMPLASCTSIW